MNTTMRQNYTTPQTEETRLDTDIRCDVIFSTSSAIEGNPPEIM